MERNDGNQDLSAGAGQNDANEFSGNGSQQDNSFDFSGTAGATGTSAAAEQAQELGDHAKDAVDSAGERLSGTRTTVRERAGTVKNRLADALESGAERLRHQRNGGDGAAYAAAATGTAGVQHDARLAQVSDRVAGGMQASADWLRDADLDSLKTSVEQQVKEHPGRTLLIAAGLGYLIGRAFRSNQ